jgi:hypothetical protein
MNADERGLKTKILSAFIRVNRRPFAFFRSFSPTGSRIFRQGPKQNTLSALLPNPPN